MSGARHIAYLGDTGSATGSPVLCGESQDASLFVSIPPDMAFARPDVLVSGAATPWCHRCRGVHLLNLASAASRGVAQMAVDLGDKYLTRAIRAEAEAAELTAAGQRVVDALSGWHQLPGGTTQRKAVDAVESLLKKFKRASVGE